MTRAIWSRFALAAVVSWCAATHALGQPAPDFWRIGGTSKTDVSSGQADAVSYVDASRVQKLPSGLRRAWVWTELRPGVEKYDEVLMLREFDCVERRDRVLELTAYTREGVAAPRTNPSAEWTYATPQTVADELMTFVCAPSEREDRFARIGDVLPKEDAADFFVQ